MPVPRVSTAPVAAPAEDHHDRNLARFCRHISDGGGSGFTFEVRGTGHAARCLTHAAAMIVALMTPTTPNPFCLPPCRLISCQVYPTQSFVDLYITDSPRNNTIAVSMIIFGCAVLFAVYDFLSRNIMRDLSLEAALHAANAKAEMELVRRAPRVCREASGKHSRGGTLDGARLAVRIAVRLQLRLTAIVRLDVPQLRPLGSC